MTHPQTAFPSFEEGLALHLRLTDEDPTASADICAAFILPLRNHLASAFPRADPHLSESAVDEALFNYILHPETYDSCALDLSAYLRMAAAGDLRNAQRKESRHHRERISFAVVELAQEDGNLSGREDEPVALLQRQEEADAWHAYLRSLRTPLDPADQRVLDLLLAGERRTAAFAEVLGLLALTSLEQEREVKRVKDRLKKRLQRWAATHARGDRRDG